MTTFRLLQASDLHLAVKPYQYGLPDSWWDVVCFRCPPSLVSSHDPDIVDAFALFAATTPPDDVDYDTLVLSGDLATTGQAPDLAFSRTFVEDAAPAGLGGDPKTIPLIAGNHDRFGPPPAGLHHPGNPQFDGVFQPYWKVGPGRAQELWRLDRGGIRLALIGVDLTLADNDLGNWLPLGWCGQGRATHRSIAELRTITDDARAQAAREGLACCVVWTIHFTPTRASAFLKLLNDDRLLTAAEVDGIPVVLCGHTHAKSALFSLPGAPNVRFCLCGSTTQYHQPSQVGNYLNLLDISFVAPNAEPVITLHPFKYVNGQFTDNFAP